MKYNSLGDTGLRLSQLSLGGGAFSNFYRKFDESSGIELFHSCFEKGMNYVDTGPWYGQGSSEITCGKALKGLPRDSFYVGCKVGRYEMDVANMFDFSAEKTHSSIELSLERLQLNYVDVIQVHDLTFSPDISVVLRETLPALAREVEQGRAKHIGLADYDLALLKDVIEETEVKIASILSYAKSTMIDNRLQKYIDYFARNGVGVINASSNGMGLLTNAGPQSWHPASAEIKSICHQAADYCKENGVELAKLSQWFSFNQPNITTHVLGIQNISHLEDAIDVMNNGLDENELKVYENVQERFFKGKTMHWDAVEIKDYLQKLQDLRTSSSNQ